MRKNSKEIGVAIGYDSSTKENLVVAEPRVRVVWLEYGQKGCSAADYAIGQPYVEYDVGKLTPRPGFYRVVEDGRATLTIERHFSDKEGGVVAIVAQLIETMAECKRIVVAAEMTLSAVDLECYMGLGKWANSMSYFGSDRSTRMLDSKEARGMLFRAGAPGVYPSREKEIALAKRLSGEGK